MEIVYLYHALQASVFSFISVQRKCTVTGGLNETFSYMIGGSIQRMAS